MEKSDKLEGCLVTSQAMKKIDLKKATNDELLAEYDRVEEEFSRTIENETISDSLDIKSPINPELIKYRRELGAELELRNIKIN